MIYVSCEKLDSEVRASTLTVAYCYRRTNDAGNNQNCGSNLMCETGKIRELSIALRKSGFATVTCICQTWGRGLQFTLFSKANPKTTWQIKEFPCSLNTYETTPDWTQEPRTKVAHKTKNTSRASNFSSMNHALNFMNGMWPELCLTRGGGYPKISHHPGLGHPPRTPTPR